MGMTTVAIKIKNPREPKKFFEGEFLVDSGASYTGLTLDPFKRKLYSGIQENPDFQSGDELNADMPSSFRGNPALQSGEDVIRLI